MNSIMIEEYDGFWGIWDEPFLQFSKSILDDKNEPFLATIFTLSSHEPYIIPDKFKGMFDKGYLPIHKCVGYTDYSIRQFFKSIEKSSWFENTIFIFTSDHTNQSYYKYYQSTVNRFATPLIIYKKNSDFKGVDNRLASHLDIYPTVAELIGYKKPFRSWGRSLFLAKMNLHLQLIILEEVHIYRWMKTSFVFTMVIKQLVFTIYLI